MAKPQQIFSLLRVHQWVKNIFIFLPIFFGLKIMQLNLLLNDVYAFIGFSFFASAVYIFNDLIDVEADRLHPKKQFRPIAAGLVTTRQALIIILVLVGAGSLLLFLTLNQPLIWVLVIIYLVQNLLYTVKLKHIAIVDIVIIALGFLIRIVLGGIVTNTPLSHWIVLITFLLALFLALAKRRDDVLLFEKTGNKMRSNIDGYNLDFLNVSMSIMSAVVIVAYIMYTTSPDVVRMVGEKVYVTSFFVVIGVMRYLQVTFVKHESGNPSIILLRDRFLQLTIAGWLATFFILLYTNTL
ncbi:UbiA prenyltransferase family protein [Mucilaginibacter ginkgonis]|uniref:UbiA prenyltransferase family protein n=1 Tax=Mucilaginibacter ginkgonis TaxID=2682091 RepID=A0A6I4HUW6_9SPHI|nr:UbiA prenyltransferase family protein [Mucilaginibacter ginkgonis]QQL50103.1 UbiA prenyltransferase family protein [Mucilaginibacter ginkgonis]